MKPVPFGYERPRSVAEALDLKAAAGDDARFLAGGQSLGPMLNLRLARPKSLIDVSRLEELRGVSGRGGHVLVGAGVTHAQIEDGLDPDPSKGLLSRVAAEIAWRAVRNRGTIGGNVAHADPLGDWGPVLFALGAKVRLRSAEAERAMPVEEFVRQSYSTAIGAAEILAAIEIPELSPKAAWGYCKLCRKVGEYAEASGVFVADPQRGVCRVVAGGAEPRPVFLPATAAALARDGREAAAAALADEIGGMFPGADRVELKIRKAAVARAVAGESRA